MKRALWYATGVLGLVCVLKFASSAEAADRLTPEQIEHIHWQFSKYLDGDTPHIRDLLNGALEQQLNRKAEKLQRIEDDKTAIAAMPANDPQIAEKKKEIADTQTELRNLGPAIIKSSKAREDLIEGIRTNLKLKGPPAVGGKGILGKIKPLKIVDAHSFTADYDAIEITGEDTKAKSADGIKALTGRAYRIRLLVTGVDTANLRVGKEATFDHTFIITGTKAMGKVDAYVIAPNDSEPRDQAFNYLFDQLADLRVKK